jgi:hypothetical protein
MPVLRDTKPKAKTALQLAADRQLEDNLEALGIGPRAEAEKAKRRDHLLSLDRDLTRDEQDELDALIIERQGERWHSKHFSALVKAAEAEWAARCDDPEFIAKWQRRALANKPNFGEPREPKWEHWGYVVTESKEAKRIKRRHSRYYEIVRKLRAGIEKRAETRKAAKRAASKVSVARPGTPVKPILGPSNVRVTLAPLEVEQPRRPRIKYGVVAQYDANGDRVL